MPLVTDVKGEYDRLCTALEVTPIRFARPAGQRRPGRTFAEQVEGLTVRYGRRTTLLRSILETIAVALAGRADARLAGSLHLQASRSTMLRLVMAVSDPSAATQYRSRAASRGNMLSLTVSSRRP